MNHRNAALVLSFVTSVATVASGCADKDPCGEGLYELPSYRCAEVPPPAEAGNADAGTPEAAIEAGGSEAGEAAAPVVPVAPAASSGFGTPCTAAKDCPGDAPICAQPKLPYCTQIDCEPGEANAGVCPAGFTCVHLPGLPSGCLKN